jgi:hypothetical protein
VLDGGLGTDYMAGGAGNDTYIVDDIGDIVFEKANGGIDTIQSSVSFDLRFARQVEHLRLTGTANLDATGNTLDNHITGNSGKNRLNGGPLGNDTLEGRDGSDAYVFGGRFGADVVRDHQTPPPATPTQPVFSGPIYFNDLGGSLSFSPELWNSLSITGGTPYNGSVSFSDGFNLNNGGLSLVDGSGTLTFSPINTNLTGSFTDLSNLGYTDTTITTLNFGDLTGTLNPNLTGLVNLSPYDLYTPGQWDDLPDTDSLRFEDVSYDKLWFKQIGQDLEVSVVGTTDKVTVRDWYTSQNDRVELTYDAGNGHVLRDDKVQGLVTAMAGFAPQALSGNAALLAARDAAWTTL